MQNTIKNREERPEVKAKIDYLFEAIDKSGITLTDVHRISSISREALYRWKKGGRIGDMLRLNMAYTLAKRLEAACRLGRLPLTDRLNKKTRVKTLRRIIADMATKVN